MDREFKNPYKRSGVVLTNVKVGVAFKKWAVQEMNAKRLSSTKIASTYRLKVGTVKGWAQKANSGTVLSEGPGRLKTFADEELEAVQFEMGNSVMDLRQADYKEIIQKAAEKTAKNRGQSIANVRVSRNTLLRASKKIGVVSGRAEATTNARIAACGEIRNQVSMAAMALSKPDVDQILVLNFDSTGFTVGGKGADDVDVKYIAKSKNKEKPAATAPSRGRVVAPDDDDQGFTRYTIKYLLLMSAGGFQADPVYVVADDNMTDEEFRVYTVPAMGVGTNLDNKGHVVIMKSRAGNTAYNAWLFKDVLIPFVRKLKEVYMLPADKWAFVTMDGEPSQVPILFDEEMRALLAANNIHVGKLPASTTAINQACDARNMFRAPKTQNKYIANKNVKDNKFLLDALVAVFKLHNEWLNSEDRGDKRLAGKRKRYQSKKGSTSLLRDS